MPSDEEIHRLRTEVSGDQEIETTFRQLRLDGYSRLEAVQIILDVLDVSLAEAKTLLLTSDTWNEARSSAGKETDANEDVEESDDPVPPAPA